RVNLYARVHTGQGQHGMEHISDAALDARAHVVDRARVAMKEQLEVSIEHVAYVGKVARNVQVSRQELGVDPPFLYLRDALRKARQDETRVLPRPCMVEGPRNTHVETVRIMPLLTQKFSGGFAGGVRVPRCGKAI